MTDKPESETRQPHVSSIRLDFGGSLLGFVILQLAIAIGWAATAGVNLNKSWKTVLIVLAAAALGFGAANLVSRGSSNSRGRELERDYEALKERSGGLSAALERFERKLHSSHSSAPSDPVQ